MYRKYPAIFPRVGVFLMALSMVVFCGFLAPLSAMGQVTQGGRGDGPLWKPMVIQASVPILMYHHFDQVGDGQSTMAISEFEAHLKALTQQGYESVSPQQLEDYVTRGIPLPKKPVMITIDDGYLSNYTLAYPLLKQYQMKATIFAIGSSMGATKYKDTDYDIIPHFTYEQGREMVNSGLVTLGSHTYDMHQWPAYETGISRPTVARLPGESDEAYQQALWTDFTTSKEQLEEHLQQPVTTFSYPKGFYNDISTQVASQVGFTVTFTTRNAVAVVTVGDRESLVNLPRMGMQGGTSAEEMLAMIESGA